MSVFLAEVQRFILVGGVRAVETTDCWWCTEKGVCSACGAKADQCRSLVAMFVGIREAVRS